MGLWGADRSPPGKGSLFAGRCETRFGLYEAASELCKSVYEDDAAEGCRIQGTVVSRVENIGKISVFFHYWVKYRIVICLKL